jgi:hypothetical protein
VNQFEEELRNALRRQDPPLGFARRVLARTPDRAVPHRNSWIAAAVAACLMLTAGAVEYRQYEGRKAKRELLLALEIAGAKLNVAQQKILDLNRRNIHD